MKRRTAHLVLVQSLPGCPECRTTRHARLGDRWMLCVVWVVLRFIVQGEWGVVVADCRYPRQKICGVWLLVVGVAMFLLLVKNASGALNPIPFAVVYALGMVWQLSPRTRRRLSVGEGSSRQKFFSNASIAVLMVLIFLSFALTQLVYGGIVTLPALRTLWLCILVSVALHFFMFIPVHGNMMAVLGVVLLVNAGAGLLFPTIPLDLVFVIDGIIKIVVGAVMIRISPTDF